MNKSLLWFLGVGFLAVACTGSDISGAASADDGGAAPLDGGPRPLDGGAAPLDGGAAPLDGGAALDAFGDAAPHPDAGTDATSSATALAPCTKYVAASGSIDGGAAYTTITAGLAAVGPGDSLCIAPGTYTEIVAVTTSGTAAQPITIRALDPSNKPVVDGAYALPPGQPDDTNCYEYAANLDLGYTYTNVDPNANLGPPPTKACLVAHGPQGGLLVKIQANHIIWDSIDVTRSRGSGVLIGNGTGDGWYVSPLDNPTTADWYTDIQFSHSTVSHNRNMGVFLGVYADTVLFEGNDVFDAGNAADYDHSTDGYGWPNAVAVLGKNVTIRQNKVHDSFTEGIIVGFPVFQDSGSIPTGTFNYAQNLVVSHNEIYDTWSVPLYINGFDGALVDANVVYSSGDSTYFYGGPTGAPLQCILVRTENQMMANPKNLLVSNNIVSGCSTLLGMLPYAGPETTYTGLAFYNNTLMNPFPGGAALSNELSQVTGYAFQNNLVYSPGASIFDNWYGFSDTLGTMALGNNLWSSAPVSSRAPGNGSTTPQANLAGGGDITTATPGLTIPGYAPTAGSFDATAIALTPSSVALSAGANIPAVLDDYFGTARPEGPYDIGAYQHP